MKISILGTNGFLSTAIATYYSKDGVELNMYGLEKPKFHNYTQFNPIDLTKEDLEYSTLCDSDIIIYAIGAGIQSNLHESNELIYNLNVTTPVKICNKLKENQYKGIFVTFGSVFEFGSTSQLYYATEEDILKSNNPVPNDYSVSKRMLTRFVSSYKKDFTHWHFFIPTIYGEYENPMRLIPYTINSIRNNSPLHFTAGDQVRQYIYVSEVPRLIDLAYQKSLASGLYNIQGMETMTVKEIVSIIHAALGKELPNDCFGKAQRNDVSMKYLALDGSKLKQAIGFEAQIRLTDIVNKY